jgi:nucleoside-diphosphate-sugar epimerase
MPALPAAKTRQRAGIQSEPNWMIWWFRFSLGDLAAHALMSMAHHADVAQGVQRALRAARPARPGYVAYNIAGDAASTMYELFELGGREFDVAAAAARAVEDPWLGVPGITRAHRELGFRPIYLTAKAAWRDGAL